MALAETLLTTFRKAFSEQQATLLTEVFMEVYGEVVKASDFNELKGIVKELANAQRRTEMRVEQLVQAQQRSEARIDRLAEKIDKLAEAQQRTEVRIEQLVETQQRTEEEVRALAQGLRETRVMVGGLSDTVGYGLEDRAIHALPSLLREHYGIEVTVPLVRKYITYPDGRHDEVNVIGQGQQGERHLHLIGEAKAQLSQRDVREFLRLVERLERHNIVIGERFLFLISYTIEPSVEETARAQGIELIWSYALPPL
jgi:hypothetical protein